MIHTNKNIIYHQWSTWWTIADILSKIDTVWKVLIVITDTKLNFKQLLNNVSDFHRNFPDYIEISQPQEKTKKEETTLKIMYESCEKQDQNEKRSAPNE